jgi:hypothetical protein
LVPAIDIDESNFHVMSSVLFFKFLKYVHWLGSSPLISKKWRLFLWTSKSFSESCLDLATYMNTLSKSGDFHSLFYQDMAIFLKSEKSLCWIRQPFFSVARL